MHLSDHQWNLVQHLLPQNPPARGRPPLDPRSILDAILWKHSLGAAWNTLPPSYPSWQTCYRYYRRWSSSGVFDQVLRLLFLDLRDRGGIDLTRIYEDGLVRFFYRRRRWTYAIDPSLDGTWQLDILRIFVGLVIQRLPRLAPLRC